MTDTNAPQVGQKFVHNRDGDVTLTHVRKAGKPPKEGWGGTVKYTDMDGVERSARWKDFRKAVGL